MSELINFRTEYQQRPLAVQSRTPHFSWQYEKSFRGEQASYRIRVATSEKLLYEGSEDMCDSGEVRSAASVGVQYGGIFRMLLNNRRRRESLPFANRLV